MLLQLGNGCTLKMASVLTKVKVNWIRIYGEYLDCMLDTVKILLSFSFAIMNKTFRNLKWKAFSNNLGRLLYLACVSTE